MIKMTLTKRTTIVLAGITGSLGAFLILIADIVYNLFQGNRLGPGLYITTYFGVFLFPLYWAGIWMIYQGLKPAGLFWSFVPCILLAFDQSTLNVFMHSSFPYRAAINDALNSSNGLVFEAITNLKSQANHYANLGVISMISDILVLILCIWIAIPILRRKTVFPRWIALLIPIFPLALSLLINIFFPGFLAFIMPYLGSGFMCILFITGMIFLFKRAAKLPSD